LGFDAGNVAARALQKPVGVDEFLDEMLFGVVFGGVSLEPGGFEGFVIFEVFGFEDQRFSGTASVPHGVAG
jgi:hypothetical protein